MFNKIMAKTESYTRFSDRLFLIITIFTCTFFIYRDFDIRMIYGYAVLGFILALHILRRFYSKKWVPRSPIKISYLCLCVCVLISFILPNTNRDADTVAYVIAMILCAAYMIASVPGEKETKSAMKVLLYTAVAVSAYVVFFVLFEDLYWKTIYHIVSPVQQDYLSYYVSKGYAITINGCTYTNYLLMFGIAVACAFYVTEKNRNCLKSKSFRYMALFLLAIILVGRRGELVSAVASLALLYILSGNRKQRGTRLGVLLGATFFVFCVFILCLPLLKHIDFLYRYAFTIENILGGHDITSGRTELYSLAWSLFKENPLFGIGLSRFVNYIPPEFRMIHGFDVRDVHCIYLQFLCECGIVGAIVRIVPLLYCYCLAVWQFNRLRNEIGVSPRLDLAIQANTISLLVQSFLFILGCYDPCFTRIIFWCFYAISILFLISAYSIEISYFKKTDGFYCFGKLKNNRKNCCKGSDFNE